VALLGSSGVGKSTLVNRLLGAGRQKTRAVREGDSRGRHTTTSRELFQLPGGALLLDTPGLREVGLWGAGSPLTGFDEIEHLAEGCGFRDCRHESEPRCRVREAIEDGTLPPERLESYRKLLAEQRHVETRRDQRVRLEEQRKWKLIQKEYRRLKPKR
jgi:ribosome biogenesis GTPase